MLTDSLERPKFYNRNSVFHNNSHFMRFVEINKSNEYRNVFFDPKLRSSIFDPTMAVNWDDSLSSLWEICNDSSPQ